MRQKTDGGFSRGFTIVETLIVLAVTGSLFVSAALYISGKQNKTEFAVGIRQVQQQFEQIINETASGYYPNTADVRCDSLNSSSPRVVVLRSGGSGQGTNANCIFVGKVIVTGGRYHKSELVTYPLAAWRAYENVDPSNRNDAYITVVAPTTDPYNRNAPDLSEKIKLSNGIEFVRGWHTTPSAVPPVVTASGDDEMRVSIVSTMGSFTSVPGGKMGGSQSYSLAGLNTFSPSTSGVDIEANDLNRQVYEKATTMAQYCFASGGTDQSGLITVGGSAGGISVALSIKSGRNC